MRRSYLLTVWFLLAACDSPVGLLDQPSFSNGTTKAVLCHDNATDGYVRIEIADPALQAHLDHGDAGPWESVPGRPGMEFTDACEVRVSWALYGVSFGYYFTTTLYEIDRATGTLSAVGPLYDGDPGKYAGVSSMAVRPADGAMFVWSNWDVDVGTITTIWTGQLLSLDPATGMATPVTPGNTGLGPGFLITGLGFDSDGRLYGLGGYPTQTCYYCGLYEITVATGAVTFVGETGLRFGGASFSSDGTLYAAELIRPGQARLVTVNTSTAAASVVGTFDPLGWTKNGFIGSIAFDPSGRLVGSALNGSTSPTSFYLFDIDPLTAHTSNYRNTSTGRVMMGMGFAPVP